MKKWLLINLVKNIILHNVNGTTYGKRALLVYITRPFLSNNIRHTNAYEAKNIAKCFDDLGYDLDVVYYDAVPYFINYSRYSIIMGFGKAYDYSLNRTKCGAIRIHLATGAYFTEANKNELRRWGEYACRNKVNNNYKDNRLEKNQNELLTAQSISLSEGIICDGDDWCISTFNEFSCPKFSVGAVGFSKYTFRDFSRDIEEAKHNFICIAGRGFIHKGIDLIIEAFEHKKEHLYILGDFEDVYKEMYRDQITENIHFMGYIDLNSKSYYEIANRCAFSVNASCSEGCCTSVLSSMMSGCIPIMSVYEGVNAQGMGLIMDNVTVNTISEYIEIAANMQNDEIMRRMVGIARIAEENYSIDAHYFRMKKALVEIIEEGKK